MPNKTTHDQKSNDTSTERSRRIPVSDGLGTTITEACSRARRKEIAASRLEATADLLAQVAEDADDMEPAELRGEVERVAADLAVVDDVLAGADQP